ncbi:unnamed protein product [Rangifer tarandus platyrhynchus]|uniref:Uncharacterized protein n=1 Tax=Rangifer tarandus platyrhynchus TaxID=3082113 RepID=A0ABN9A107_RANTA|nr:unnamed protein product [Rangifer tarandus platyrhynchus]
MLAGSLSTGPPAARPLPGCTDRERRAAGPAPLGVRSSGAWRGAGLGRPHRQPPTHPWGSHPSLPPADTHSLLLEGILPPSNKKLYFEGSSSGLKMSATPSNIQVRSEPLTCYHGAQCPLHEK